MQYVEPEPEQTALLQSWAESIEAKDEYTARHCTRVTEYMARLTAAMGMDGGANPWLGVGSMLHDMGKLGVPSAILNKPGRLTAEEWRVMRMHPEWGDRLAVKMRLPETVRSIVRHHHERWDGTGYPDGLGERAIPLVARMLCVVDVYDALTSHRSYRPALSQEEALLVMRSEAGSTLDPAIFRTFRNVLRGAVRPQAYVTAPAA